MNVNDNALEGLESNINTMFEEIERMVNNKEYTNVNLKKWIEIDVESNGNTNFSLKIKTNNGFVIIVHISHNFMYRCVKHELPYDFSIRESPTIF
jgi:hypothetical protein